MSKSVHLICSLSLIAIATTSPAMGWTPVQSETYEKHPGALLEEAPYISGFECLVHGENTVGKPACDYYKAQVSGPQASGKISGEICFKELTSLISEPREYKAETIYSLIVEPKQGNPGRKFEGVTFARILSLPTLPDGQTTLWYVTTTVALYDCDIPYDGKSYN